MSDYTIRKLKKKFNDEINEYLGREIGSGTQDFVHEVLLSPEIFKLKKGKLSTKVIDRKNEVIKESPKKGKQIDYVIYIDSDIIIPVEVERLENIEKGKDQILEYQQILEKKYGILTDGNIWRFYNNTIYREFTWSDISENTKEFLTFWKEYIKPEYYYLQYFEDIGQNKLIKDEGAFNVENNRTLFFNDITLLIDSFKNKLSIEKYFEGLDKKEKAKKSIEITYAYIIQFILYKTLVDNNFDDFKKEFEDRQNSIYEALKAKQYKNILGITEGISNKISKNVYRSFSQEQEFINNTLLDLIRNPKNELHDVSPWLDIFVFIKKYNFQNIQNEVFGYIYENYLKELFEETKKGQYFTDPAVVNFMLDQIGYNKEEIKKKRDNEPNVEHISIIDPSCGSGTFLYSAVDRIIDSFDGDTELISKEIEDLVINNVFGLDIAEFPLYLAEMNIIMRLLPLIINEKYNNPIDKKIKVFLTQDSIAEFIGEGLFDKHKKHGQASMFDNLLRPKYNSYVRDEIDLNDMKDSLKNYKDISRKRFDFVIGNPPYVSYNECSKQGVLIFNLIKQGKAKLNDIFGVNLHSTPDNPKRYRPNPNLYSFFIALGMALLKDNAKLCYIIPQTVLINTDYDVIRYHLAKFTQIDKIITFSGKMFLGRGIKQTKPVATSSLIFVLSKTKVNRNHNVEVIHYNEPKDNINDCLKNISLGKNINKKLIKQVELLNNIVSWNFIKQDKNILDFYINYKNLSEDISNYYNHVLAEKNFGCKFFFDGGYSIDEKKLLSTPIPKLLNYKIPHLDDNYWTIKKNFGYWPNVREKNDKMFIELRQGNQAYNFIDNKYKLIWSYNNTTKFFFTDDNIIWARNKLLGISSNNKKEILYLFSLLNSKITTTILNKLVKVDNEDTRTILVSLQIIKDILRIPKINDNNKYIKDEIIKMTEILLDLEKFTLNDYIDFSKILQQKFNDIDIKSGDLILISEGKEIKLKIKSNKKVVEQAIKDKYFDEKLKLEDKKISLSELKSLQVIDFEKQKELKDYIDDLVFALYFNVAIKKVGLSKAKEIKKLCKKNKFYKVIEESFN